MFQKRCTSNGGNSAKATITRHAEHVVDSADAGSQAYAISAVMMLLELTTMPRIILQSHIRCQIMKPPPCSRFLRLLLLLSLLFLRSSIVLMLQMHCCCHRLSVLVFFCCALLILGFPSTIRRVFYELFPKKGLTSSSGATARSLVGEKFRRRTTPQKGLLA